MMSKNINNHLLSKMVLKKSSQRNISLDDTPNLSKRNFMARGSILIACGGLVNFYPSSSSAVGLFTVTRIPLRPTISILVNPIGFNGERIDPITKGYNLGGGYRHYRPSLMCFMQFDSDASPFGEGGVNGYSYAMGDPVLFIDPTGRSISLSEALRYTFAYIINGLTLVAGVVTANPLLVVGAIAGIAGTTFSLAAATQEEGTLKDTLNYVGLACSVVSAIANLGAATQALSSISNTASTVKKMQGVWKVVNESISVTAATLTVVGTASDNDGIKQAGAIVGIVGSISKVGCNFKAKGLKPKSRQPKTKLGNRSRKLGFMGDVKELTRGADIIVAGLDIDKKIRNGYY
ncbi:hypothetical protein AKG98_3752 [Moritella sp. JT01]|uniref:RHS repeat-associated core domain-containing protein n=1 Tax=Moritella sp. JT01 TaxID=756698 RepID=UPI00079314D7|nr:RHS repeat-associated core domain-containing protein [Moritella sp. JT01]KXO12558.1 hypothetical protein AKG98_3752 [Moritella sp. JT01]